MPLRGFILAALAACLGAPAGRPLRADQQYGYQRTIWTVAGRRAFAIQPASQRFAEGKRPWAWYAPTFIGGHPNRSNQWLFKQLLEAGWTVAGVEVGESYGSPAGRKTFSEFHADAVQRFGLAPKACLVAQSRGGLMHYNWAVENVDKVACIVGIYPVCDPRSYPGLARAAPAYGLSAAELEDKLAEHNPIERLAPLARAKTPILHIHGDSDRVVPLEANSRVLIDRYKALGGPGELIVVKGKGHAEIPEFFEAPAPLKFLIEHGRPKPPP